MLLNLPLEYCVQFWSSVLKKDKQFGRDAVLRKAPVTNERMEYLFLGGESKGV